MGGEHTNTGQDTKTQRHRGRKRVCNVLDGDRESCMYIASLSLSLLSYLSSTSGKCSNAMWTNELESIGNTLAMVTPDGE